MVVNRFVIESRNQSRRYQSLASDLSEVNQSLSEANQSLKKAQADARRAERLAALGQLSAGLAHEIRNPLGVIKGSAEILTQKLSASDAMAKELSSYIYTEVNRVSALVSRFLDFARPLRLTLHAAELPPVVERALKSVADQGALTHVEVKREFSSGLPKVMMDEELCDQVFTNVLLNACQAMGETGGTLRVSIHADNLGAHSVIVDIEDSGPGVDAELREQIFNPFVTTKKTGVGLGLAIVSKIMDAHDGSIKLITNSSPGACFRLTFVAADSTPTAEAAHANAATQ
jgi:signal transduction histidine kinase